MNICSRVCGPRGLKCLLELFEQFKSKGDGHEVSELSMIFNLQIAYLFKYYLTDLVYRFGYYNFKIRILGSQAFSQNEIPRCDWSFRKARRQKRSQSMLLDILKFRFYCLMSKLQYLHVVLTEFTSSIASWWDWSGFDGNGYCWSVGRRRSPHSPSNAHDERLARLRRGARTYGQSIKWKQRWWRRERRDRLWRVL